MRIVLDSNVLVSGLLSPHAPPAQVLRLVLQGDLVPLHDDRILAEYSEVLSRPKFDFDPQDVRTMLHGIEWSGETVFARPLQVVLPDPDDLPFLEVASAAHADALVTGNRRHYQAASGAHDVPILTPRELIDLLAREPGP
jgi:putative PIN family toxin of toxin-antitoxin system